MHESPTDAESARQAADQRDAAELRRFGYLQQLRRSMGWFSSFAISFSMISISTGIFANFGMALVQVGPALLWSWCLVVVGQLLVAIVLAELAVHYPLSGYGYQWASRLVNPHFGFFVGWLLVLQYVTGFPGICQTLATQIHAVWENWLHNAYGPHAAVPASVPWLTVGVMTVTALIHLFGIRLASLVNSAGVVAEIVGATLITVVLLALFGLSRPEAVTFLFEHPNFATGLPAGLPAFALSLLMGAWCITGFEAAADLSEETHDPRRNVPRAILSSQLSAGIGGFLMLLAFVLAIENLPALQQAASEGRQPLVEIIRGRLGDGPTACLMLIVMVAVFNCGVASLAHTSRLLFALARDNMLPGSQMIKAVHPRSQSPVNAILVVWMASSLVVLTMENLQLITSVATVSGYLGYGSMVLTSLLARRARGRQEGFTLGAASTAVAVAALVWTLVVVLALTIPETDGGHLPVISTAAGLGLGVLLYFAVVQGRLNRGEAGPPVSPAN